VAVANLRIETGGSPVQREWKMYLNDMSILKYVRNVRLEFGLDHKIGIATIEFIVKPDIPDELKALIAPTIYDPLELMTEGNYGSHPER
jgi:hypothetical protein